MKSALDERVAKLLCFIQDNPGCHLRQIKNELHMSMGAVQYQLIRLERAGKITSFRHGLYKFYFPCGAFQDNEKDVLRILRRETARDILILIIERKNPTQTDIVNSMGIWIFLIITRSALFNYSKKNAHIERNHVDSDPILHQLTNYIPLYRNITSTKFLLVK
jgi:hypothetical protein